MKQNLNHFRWCQVVAIALMALITTSRSYGESILKDGDRLAIVGDSITEQRQYSVFIECYLRMCQPKKVDVMQFGWSGEASNGFLSRMKNDVLPFKPTLATTCYGMNDGAYKAIDDNTRDRYRTTTTNIVEQFKSAGVRVIIGSPGAVDTTAFKRGPSPEVYNQTLAALRDTAKEVADATGSGFANLHDPLINVTTKTKQKFGNDFSICGGDGYHPAASGHLVMAYAFLKAMELDGEIATITVDLAASKAEASAGHKIQSVEAGAVKIESSIYPFCFGGKPATTMATSEVIAFFPFNQDLNRFTLIAKNAPSKKYRVTWGPTSKEYTAEALKAGVNLANDFIQNPFSEPFNLVERKIREKQAYETRMVKGIIHSLGDERAQVGNDPAFDATEAVLRKKHAALTDAINQAVAPVMHTIQLDAVD